MVEKNGNGGKSDYRALIRYLSWVLITVFLSVFGFVVSAQVKLNDKTAKLMECKVEKKEYREDVKESKQEMKDFRKEVREDMKEIKGLIKEVSKRK